VLVRGEARGDVEELIGRWEHGPMPAPLHVIRESEARE
jgi:hypothetical protein